MINVLYRNGIYSLRLNMSSDNIQSFKFDTGAIATMCTMSIEDDNVIRDILNYAMKNHAVVKNLYSAFGDCREAISCYINNIKIGDMSIRLFHYWLVLGNFRGRKALLGDGFIKYCSFSHTKCGDIVINSVDLDSYYESVLQLSKHSIKKSTIDSISDKIFGLDARQFIVLTQANNGKFEYIKAIQDNGRKAILTCSKFYARRFSSKEEVIKSCKNINNIVKSQFNVEEY